MNLRIAFYSHEFRLCEWPYLDKPSHCGGKPDCCSGQRCRVLVYDEAITSAMENGVRFEDQEEVKNYLVHKLRIGFRFTEKGLEAAGTFDESSAYDKEGKLRPTPSINDRDNGFRWWNPKEGENWPAPEGVEIIGKETKCPECDGNTLIAGSVPCPKCNARGKLYHKVAVLRSESVEKKEEWKIVTNGFGMPAIKLTSKKIKVLTPSRYSVFTLDELQSIADRLNQSTTKE